MGTRHGRIRRVPLAIQEIARSTKATPLLSLKPQYIIFSRPASITPFLDSLPHKSCYNVSATAPRVHDQNGQWMYSYQPTALKIDDLSGRATAESVTWLECHPG